MYRYTTPTHRVKFKNADPADFDWLFMTYVQDGITVLEKELSDFEVGEDFIEVTLTQEETARFHPDDMVRIQIRAGIDGRAAASREFIIDVQDVLKEGEISE